MQIFFTASDCHALDPNVCNDTNKVVCHHGGICVRCYDPNSPTSSPYCRTAEDFLRHHVYGKLISFCFINIYYYFIIFPIVQMRLRNSSNWTALRSNYVTV